MDKKIIVFVGGPGSGKTTLIEALNKKGYVCYPEISRQITIEAQKHGTEQLFLEKPLLFSELLLEGRVAQYKEALQEETSVVFIDRGIPDVLAYLHYIGDAYPKTFVEACKNHLYSKIFIFPPWEEIYQTDNERYENFEQSLLIHSHLVETYQKFGYSLIEVPKIDLKSRVNFILNNL